VLHEIYSASRGFPATVWLLFYTSDDDYRLADSELRTSDLPAATDDVNAM